MHVSGGKMSARSAPHFLFLHYRSMQQTTMSSPTFYLSTFSTVTATVWLTMPLSHFEVLYL